jgi:hypothetical protein
MVNAQTTSDRRIALREALAASAQRIIAEHGYSGAARAGCRAERRLRAGGDLQRVRRSRRARSGGQGAHARHARSGNRQTTSAAQAPPNEDASSARDAAEQSLQNLAALYLAFASQHPRLWQAVFEHRSPDPSVPDAYMAKLAGVLGYVERPLEVLAPELTPADRQLWARALFSAVHGVVALGLDQKLGPLSAKSLKWQVGALVHAAMRGISSR